MASSFGQYKGGIRPVEGIQQAGATIAKYTYEGLAGAGANLAEGIKTYQSNVAQNEQATEELNQIGQALIKQKQMLGDNPEFAEFGARLDPLIESVSGAPSKSLSQKLAILNSAKATMGTTGADLQMYQALKASKAQQDMQRFSGQIPQTETIQGGAFIQDGKYAYNGNQDYGANKQQFLGAINQMKKLAESRGEKYTVDVNAALRNYNQNSILGVQKAQQAGQISAEQAAITIEQLQNAENELDRQMMPEGMYYADQGASPTQSSLAQYQDEKSMATPVAQTLAEQKAVKTTTAVGDNTEFENKKNQTAINAKLRSYDEESAKIGKETVDLMREKTELQTNYSGFSAQVYSPDARGGFNPRKKVGQKITFANEEEYKTWKRDFDNSPEAEKGYGFKVDRPTSEQLAKTDSRLQEIDSRISAIAERRKVIEKESQSVYDKSKAGPQGQPVPLTPTVKAEEIMPTFGTGDIYAGTREAVVPISIDVKKEKLQAHFQKSWGYIPSNFDAIFKSLNPEANLQVIDTKWGPMQWDGKTWNQLDMNKAGYSKPLTTAQQREAVRGVFGQQRQDGSYTMVEKVPGSGVKVGGLFTGTDEALGKFNDILASAGPAIKGVARLMEINDKFGESIQGDLIGEAGSIANSIIANLRTSIVGVGVVSDKDQKILENIVADPTRWLSLESADRARYVQLAKRITDNLKAQAAVNGLTLSVEGDSKATEKNLRTNRLLTK